MPAAEVDVTVDLVRRLLVEQHPDLAHLSLTEAAFGWDNVMFRLGGELSVRLPRRAMSAPLVDHEIRWLPVLAPRLPLPIPAPVRSGHPGGGYPWSWSVCPWFDGEPAAVRPPDDAAATARALGDFLRALHRPAPADVPQNPYRGVPLADRSAVTVTRIDSLHDVVDAPGVRSLWEDLAATRPWDGPPVWLHGDLHAGNVVVRDGAIAAVVDWGDLTGGDPATDLAAAWMLLPTDVRDEFRAAVGDVDDDTWRRARGWALVHGVGTLAASADNPVMAAVGHATLTAVIEDSD